MMNKELAITIGAIGSLGFLGYWLITHGPMMPIAALLIYSTIADNL
jgi:hypothetical protein